MDAPPRWVCKGLINSAGIVCTNKGVSLSNDLIIAGTYVGMSTVEVPGKE